LSETSDEYRTFTGLMRRRAFADAAALAERQSVEQSGGSDFWLTQYSRALLRGGRPREAYEAAARVLRSSPRNAYAILARADAAQRLGRPEEALADYEQLADDSRLGGRARDGALNCLERLGSWQKLLEQTTRWDLPPDRRLRWTAKALAGMGRRGEAMETCRKWLDLSPDNPQGLWLLTELRIERDGLDAVRAEMARMAKIPSRPPIYGEIHASLCRRAGLNESALGQYEKLARSQSDPRIMRKHAFMLAKRGRELEALPIMEELLRGDPRDPYVHSSYGAACRRVGRLDRAEAFYHELLERHPAEKGLYGRLKRVSRGRQS
jgi:Flp pilus assembly protein TadD